MNQIRSIFQPNIVIFYNVFKSGIFEGPQLILQIFNELFFTKIIFYKRKKSGNQQLISAIIQMESDSLVESLPSDQPSQIDLQQEENCEDEFEMFQNDDLEQQRDWRDALEKAQPQNEFLQNDKDLLMQDTVNIKDQKPKKKESKEKQAYKAYSHFLRSFTVKEVMKNVRRMETLSQMKTEMTGKMLSTIGEQGFKRLIEAKNAKPEVLMEAINRVLIESDLKGEKNLIDKVICLLNFCGKQARMLALVSLDRFSLLGKFKIMNQKKKGKYKRMNTKEKITEYIKLLSDSEDSFISHDIKRKNSKKQKQLNRSKQGASDEQSESSSEGEFDDLDKYSFMSKKYINTFVSQDEGSKNISLKPHQIDNYYLKPYEWLEIYIPKYKQWKIFNLNTFSFSVDDDVKRSIEGMATVFIYSAKILNINKKYLHLFQKRPLKTIELADQTLRFCDGISKIKKRRTGLDLRLTLQKLLKFGTFDGPQCLLNAIENECRKNSEKAIYKIALDRYFPISKFEFLTSDYFVLESQVPKFEYLPLDAVPIEGVSFQGQSVYNRSSLVHLHSQSGWIDIGRMVKPQQLPNPKKNTLSKQNKDLRLYEFDQTVPFKWELQNNRFVKNEYQNVYINPFTVPPKGVVIIPENVNYVCKKQGFEFARVVQGFKNSRANYIGTAIFLKDKEEILKLQKERLQYLAQKKANGHKNLLLRTWRKIFKSIRVSNEVKQRYANKK